MAFELGVWEREILPARVKGFTRYMLDELVARGHWVGVGYGPKLAFVPRHLLSSRPHGEALELSQLAQRISTFLETRGASYLLDIELEVMDTQDALLAALGELAGAGLVSNDRMESLRAMLNVPNRAVAMRAPDDWGRYPQGMRQGNTRSSHIKNGRWRNLRQADLGGRWCLLSSVSEPTDLLELAVQAAVRVERMVQRHGFSCRDLHDAAADGPWRQCYDVLTRMEWAGTVRRGYYVEGIGGAQFALPGIRLEATSSEVTWLSMMDPANLYAKVEMKWPEGVRIPRAAGSWIALVGGQAVLAAVAWGGTLTALAQDWPSVQRALETVPQLLVRLPRPEKHFLYVKKWLGWESVERGILGSPAEVVLRGVGFARDTQGLRLYRLYPQTADPSRPLDSRTRNVPD